MKIHPASVVVTAALAVAFALGMWVAGLRPDVPAAGVARADEPRAQPAHPPRQRAGPSTVPATGPAGEFDAVAAVLGAGTLRGGVYTVTVPRDDLEVGQIDIGELPVAAGIESAFHFFPCPCGKASAVGQFVVADYEANDVIDELRAANVKVAAVAPMFIGDKPRLLLIRFHGEGSMNELAKAVKQALKWTGENRNVVE